MRPQRWVHNNSKYCFIWRYVARNVLLNRERLDAGAPPDEKRSQGQSVTYFLKNFRVDVLPLAVLLGVPQDYVFALRQGIHAIEGKAAPSALGVNLSGLALRAKNNPCCPDNEHKPAKSTEQLVRRGDLLQQDKAADTGNP